MMKTEKAPNYIKRSISDEEKKYGIFCIRVNGEKKTITFSELPDGLTGKLVCIHNKNRTITTNGWWYDGRNASEGSYLKIDCPYGLEPGFKIFKLDESSLL